METVSERLKEVLRVRDITQKELVEVAEPVCKKYGMKLSPSKLNQYVTGKSRPDTGMIILLAEVLDVNPAWLDGWDAPMKEITPTSDDTTDERIDELKSLFLRLTPFEQKRILAEIKKKASEL